MEGSDVYFPFARHPLRERIACVSVALQQPRAKIPADPDSGVLFCRCDRGVGRRCRNSSLPRAQSQLHGNRLLHAFPLYRAGKAPMIMISGGNVFPQAGLDPEAAYSRAILEDWGFLVRQF